MKSALISRPTNLEKTYMWHTTPFKKMNRQIHRVRKKEVLFLFIQKLVREKLSMNFIIILRIYHLYDACIYLNKIRTYRFSCFVTFILKAPRNIVFLIKSSYKHKLTVTPLPKFVLFVEQSLNCKSLLRNALFLKRYGDPK